MVLRLSLCIYCAEEDSFVRLRLLSMPTVPTMPAVFSLGFSHIMRSNPVLCYTHVPVDLRFNSIIFVLFRFHLIRLFLN